MFHPREMLAELNNGQKELAETNAELMSAFANFGKTNFKTGTIDAKTKELIAVAVALYARCEYCIVHHVYKAIEVGATREEIAEAAIIAISLGGGPAMTYMATLLKETIDEFANDFKEQTK